METPKKRSPASTPVEEDPARPSPDRTDKEIEDEMDDYIESVRRISTPEKSRPDTGP
jgi:hypothetical protein